jgi:nucleoside-diphosphate-sugar epimerase
VVTERILIAGAGWLGGALARTLLAARYEVVVLRRDAAQLKALAEAGATPLALDLAAPGAAKRIPGAIDAIVACQSAGDDTPDAYRAAYVASNAALLDAAARLRVSAFVYTGSTGVFGQRDGGDVVEGSPPAPSGPAGEVLAEAEGLVLGAAEGGVPARIVRLSGLYGPGRTGIVERVRSGRLALGPGDDAWMNFCHLEDAVAIVVAALLRGEPGRVYHGSDAAVPGPNRRIRSEWTRATLGVELRVPTFREGLRDVLASPAP